MFLDPYGGHYLFQAFNLKNYSFFKYYLFFQIRRTDSSPIFSYEK